MIQMRRGATSDAVVRVLPLCRGGIDCCRGGGRLVGRRDEGIDVDLPGGVLFLGAVEGRPDGSTLKAAGGDGPSIKREQR